MDAETLERVRKLEKAVEALLELHPQARARLRPLDAMAIADEKDLLKPGLLEHPWTSPPSS